MVVVVLGVRYAGDTAAGRIDERVRGAVDLIPAGRGGLADLVWSLGDPVPVGLVTMSMTLVLMFMGRRRLAVVALAGPVVTGVATTLLKPLFDRTFDGNGGLAFPSGHTAAIAALTVIALLGAVSLLHLSPTWSVAVVGTGVFTVGAVTALALTALNLHYPTDVMGGIGTAVAVVLTIALATDGISDRCGVLSRPDPETGS